MDYQKHYDRLIKRGKKRCLNEYVERHHIIPTCLGGSDDKSNIVELTPEEHYVAHQLLIKIYPNEPKLVFAAHMMAKGRSGNKLYAWLRKKHSKLTSSIGKQRIGKKNGSFGTRWICNIDLRENKKISKDDEIPEGWIAGRNKWKKLNTTNFSGYRCSFPRKREFTLYKRGKAKAESLWDDFINSNHMSLKSFSKDAGISQESLSHYFRNYIDEYSTKRRVSYKTFAQVTE